MYGVRDLIPGFIICLVALAFCASCSKMAKQEVVPAGSPMTQSIHFHFAIYYLPSPSRDPLVALRKTLAEEHPKLTLVEKMPEDPREMLVSAYVQANVQKEFAPPDMKSLEHFGNGLTREQAEGLQRSKHAFILQFGHSKENVWEGLRAACVLAEEIARKTGGLLWDEETREVFSPDEWHKKRIASWTDSVPDISDHTTIHAYKSDEYVRAITLGMSKFGLPDVVVENFSWSMNRTVGNLINLFCQNMAEGATFKKSGEFDLDLRSIKNRKVRDPQVESLKSNATGVAYLSLRKGKAEEGDPPNRLVEIFFDRYTGRDVHAKQEKMLSSFFGSEDSVTAVRHNDELLAASRKAKAHLPVLYEAFKAGLQPGEYIQVKAPFSTPDGGHEWMWVEITVWQGNTIKGLLKNEPYKIPSLHGGQIVQVKQEDVFDYMRSYPDGRSEGNQTGTIIRRLQQDKET